MAGHDREAVRVDDDRAMTVCTWSRLDVAHGLGFARFDESGRGVVVSGSEVVADGDQRWALRFRVELDPAWHTRVVELVVTDGDGERRREMRADGSGAWEVDGEPAPALDGCLDVDVGAAPFSNTFVIRRMDMPVGERVELAVAFVDVPSLEGQRLRQSYRHLDAHRWEYADEAYGSFEIAVDPHGVVTDYAGFARRV
jgi:hypothetical protein